MRSLKPQNLGERLERERARRFVGRKEELELIRTRLAAARSGPDMPNLFSALWVYGPGGIGKSSLLATYAHAARGAGFAVAEVDCGRITPSPEAIRTAVNDSLASSVGPSVASPSLIILDSAERRVGRGLAARRVLAGCARRFGGSHRQPQTARCCMALGSGLARDASSDLAAQPVRHTHPYAASSRRDRCRPAVEGIDVDLLDQVMALTYGHPLATSLLIGHPSRGRGSRGSASPC